MPIVSLVKKPRSLPGPPSGEEATLSCTHKAVRMLGARGLADARRQAERVLESAWRCSSCTSLLANMFDRIGSTFFLDDDPAALVQAFGEGERDRFSVNVLAACIVLRGRERMTPAL